MAELMLKLYTERNSFSDSHIEAIHRREEEEEGRAEANPPSSPSS